MKTKNYSSAPLPFQGQKRRFVKQFIEVIKMRPGRVYVDLFGGSGLLSHVAKSIHPDARVIFNDYDNFSQRLGNIPKTNVLLSDLRELNKGINPDAKLSDSQRERVLRRIKQETALLTILHFHPHCCLLCSMLNHLMI
jgi:site-specific DNA-adenine methylase